MKIDIYLSEETRENWIEKIEASLVSLLEKYDVEELRRKVQAEERIKEQEEEQEKCVLENESKQEEFDRQLEEYNDLPWYKKFSVERPTLKLNYIWPTWANRSIDIFGSCPNYYGIDWHKLNKIFQAFKDENVLVLQITDEEYKLISGLE